MKEEKLNFFLKHISKAVKVAKTFLVLKCTKKIKQLRDEGKPDDDEAMKLAAQQHLSAKSISHTDLAKAIVYIKYPYMSRDQDGVVRMDDANVQHVMASKQFQHAMSEIEEKWAEHEAKEIEYRQKGSKGKMRRDGGKSQKSDVPLRAAKLVGQKRGKEKVPLGKAMFVDTLDSESAVVIGKPGDNHDEVNEVKRLKSLRNQRNRIVNRLKRDNQANSTEDMNIYLPVHLRNLPEPAVRKTKGMKESNAANTASSQQPDRNKADEFTANYKARKGDKHGRDDGQSGREGRSRDSGRREDRRSSEPAPSHYDNLPEKKRKHLDQDTSAPTNKRPKPNQAHTHTNSAAAPVVDIALAAAGRHWQEAGIHPSWAAKQLKQQQAISIPPAGMTASKKIVFED
eukprot:gene31153-37650_t